MNKKHNNKNKDLEMESISDDDLDAISGGWGINSQGEMCKKIYDSEKCEVHCLYAVSPNPSGSNY
jgi:hypothetical protein